MTFGTYQSVRSKEVPVVKIAHCLLTINIQRLLCTLIKFLVVEEAKEAGLKIISGESSILS